MRRRVRNQSDHHNHADDTGDDTPDADDRALSEQERTSAERAALDAVGEGTVELVEASDDGHEVYEVEVRARPRCPLSRERMVRCASATGWVFADTWVLAAIGVYQRRCSLRGGSVAAGDWMNHACGPGGAGGRRGAGQAGRRRGSCGSTTTGPSS